MKAAKSLPLALIIASLVMLGLFAAAYALPAHFWGINFHAYLSPIVGILIVLMAFVVAWGTSRAENKLGTMRKLPSWCISLVAAGVMGALFYFLYIQTKLYGDTQSILKTMGKGGVFADTYSLPGAFSPNIFTTKNGEQFSYSLAAGISKGLNVEIWMAFRLLISAFGTIYAFIWMEFVQYRVKTLAGRVVAAAVGLTAGATQVFYSHPEVYAAPMLLFTAYLVALVHYLDSRKKAWLWALVPLLLLAIRSHSAGFALVPTLLYAVLVAWAGNDRKGRAGHAPTAAQWTTWQRAGWMLPAACLFMGILGYFTLFQAGDDSISTNSKAGNMFLTLTGDATADNAYYVFSKWHLWDFVQELLLCGAVAVTVILGFLIAPFRKQHWGGAATIGGSIGAVLLLALYFAIDPLLTMPRDWDLFSLIAPPILVLAVLLLAAGEFRLSGAWFPMGLLLAIAGLQASFVVVNHDPKAVHIRQLDVTRHIFLSGDAGGAFLVRHALDALPGTARDRIAELDRRMQELAPYENRHNKVDFAYLFQYGGAQSFGIQDYAAALRFYEAAYQRLPGQVIPLEDLAVTEYHLQHFERALQYARLAMASGSQRSTIWVLGFVSAMNIGNNALALQFGDDYLRRFGDPDGLRPQIEALRASP